MTARFLKSNKSKVGKAPGTLIHTGEKFNEKTSAKHLLYNEETIAEGVLTDLDRLNHLEPEFTHWIAVQGIHDVEYLEKLANTIDLDPLLLEDVLNVGQRPKIDFFDDFIFFTTKIFHWNDKEEVHKQEQISIIAYQNKVITFCENKNTIFNPIFERLNIGKKKIRTLGGAYLLYAILDLFVDQYLFQLSSIGEAIEQVETQLSGKNADDKSIQDDIYHFKREVNFMRKSLIPTREAIYLFAKCDHKICSPKIAIHLSELRDHITHTLEASESYREILSDQMNWYTLNVNNRMNDVMKVLTIFSTIFIPCTFIAGIYGTNFDYIPELKHESGYFIMLAAMVIISVVMLLWFKRKKWL